MCRRSRAKQRARFVPKPARVRPAPLGRERNKAVAAMGWAASGSTLRPNEKGRLAPAFCKMVGVAGFEPTTPSPPD